MTTSATVDSDEIGRISHAPIPSRGERGALVAAGILLSLWLLWPALHPVHVEALSTRSQSLAILDMQGKLPLDDQTYPVNVEYFFGLRVGIVKALELVMRATHSRDDVNFHLLVSASFLLLLAASFLFARRWSVTPLWAAFVFAVLTPGLVEIAFYFSDNLPSAALACLALALVGRRTSPATWLLVGVVIAAATLCRSDGILVLPGILALSLLGTDRRWSRILLNWLALAAGMIALFSLRWRATGMSLIHVFRISSWIGHLHLAASSWLFLAHSSLTMFFGIPGILLIAAGIYTQWPRQSLREKLCLTVYPVLFYLYFITKAIEPRNFLLLGAPFLILHGGAGMRVFASSLLGADRRQKTLALAIGAACLLLMSAPPRITMSDGPHLLFGRLWTPRVWRQWQSTIAADMTRYDALSLPKIQANACSSSMPRSSRSGTCTSSSSSMATLPSPTPRSFPTAKSWISTPWTTSDFSHSVPNNRSPSSPWPAPA